MMTRGFWAIGIAFVISLSAACGGTAVLDGPGDNAGGSGSQSSTRSVTTTTVGPSSVGPTTSSLGPTTSATVSSGPGNCFQQPDFLSCANCLCQADVQGCQAYIDAIDANIYCGQSCGMMCAQYCADPNNPPPASCEMCVAGIDCASPPPGSPEEADCDGFIATCQANTTCVGFVQSLQSCPQ